VAVGWALQGGLPEASSSGSSKECLFSIPHGHIDHWDVYRCSDLFSCPPLSPGLCQWIVGLAKLAKSRGKKC
jgi:hypothetical protein